ncbi:GxxExxY protein [Limnoraphis robusta CS-951]|uniref:GxxExxY protein n=2 Tax=Limnoraphis TaxID=1332112 RepID=A0A0F5YA12_9CYAN|nr:GxxExxY protein [Limnoraphis robusta CS-951]
MIKIRSTRRHEVMKMYRDPISEEVNQVAKQIVDAAFTVHSTLGAGLLESVYEVCLDYELTKRGLRVARQVSLPVIYDDIQLDAGFRLDLLVDQCVIVELKAVPDLLPVHTAQVITYLKLSQHRLGFLINFNVPLIKDGIKRIAL